LRERDDHLPALGPLPFLEQDLGGPALAGTLANHPACSADRWALHEVVSRRFSATRLPDLSHGGEDFQR
jgi:hypothetical protein